MVAGPDLTLICDKQEINSIKSANAISVRKQNHFLFFINASTDTITTANTTPPEIPYISSAGIPEPEDDFLIG